MDRVVKSLEMVEDAERWSHVENSNLGYALLTYGCPGINIKKDEYSESKDDKCDYFSDEGDDSDDEENDDDSDDDSDNDSDNDSDDDENEEEENEEESGSENDVDMDFEGVAFDGDDLNDSESDNDHHEVDDDELQEGEDTSDWTTHSTLLSFFQQTTQNDLCDLSTNVLVATANATNQHVTLLIRRP